MYILLNFKWIVNDYFKNFFIFSVLYHISTFETVYKPNGIYTNRSGFASHKISKYDGVENIYILNKDSYLDVEAKKQLNGDYFNIDDLNESSSTINPFDLNKVITTIYPKKEKSHIHRKNKAKRKTLKKQKKWHPTTLGGLPPLINIIICFILKTINYKRREKWKIGRLFFENNTTFVYENFDEFIINGKNLISQCNDIEYKDY